MTNTSTSSTNITMIDLKIEIKMFTESNRLIFLTGVRNRICGGSPGYLSGKSMLKTNAPVVKKY